MHQENNGKWDGKHSGIQLGDHAKADIKCQLDQIFQILFPNPLQGAENDQAHEQNRQHIIVDAACHDHGGGVKYHKGKTNV